MGKKEMAGTAASDSHYNKRLLVYVCSSSIPLRMSCSMWSTTSAAEYLNTHTHTHTHLSATVLINKGSCDDGTCNA
jgi:hypothetical protein